MIKVHHMSRHFGDFQAVNEISFSVPEGSICGFIGPNGAGKTTTMRILVTLEKASAGYAEVNGYRVDHRPDIVRHSIGYMPDYYGAYPDLICLEYLDFFAHAYRLKRSFRKQKIEEICAFTELEELLYQTVDSLSKGQRQRLSLARALLSDPPLLVLDEPAAGLDPRARIELRELLKLLAEQGKTVFISSHILTELSDLVSHVVIIERGIIRYSGLVDTLTAQAKNKVKSTQYKIEILNDPALTLRFLLEQPGILSAKNNAKMIQIELDEAENNVPHLIQSLVTNGHLFCQFYRQEKHLESLFLEMTGGEH